MTELFAYRTVSIKIGGVNYHIQELLACKRDEFLFELSDIVGNSLPILLDNFFADVEDLKDKAVTSALYGIFRGSNKTPAEKVEFIKKWILESVKSPKSASMEAEYDFHFMQHYEHRSEILWEILKLNFGPAVQNLKKKLLNSGIFTRKYSESKPNQSEQALKSGQGLKPFPKVNH